MTNWLTAIGRPDLAKSADLFLYTLEPKVHGHYADELANAVLGDTYLTPNHGGSVRLRIIKLYGRNEFYMRFYAWWNPGKVEVRLDSPKGELLSVADITPENSQRVVRSPMRPVDGTHDLYLVFTANSPRPQSDIPVCHVDWVAFRKCRTEATSACGRHSWN